MNLTFSEIDSDDVEDIGYIEDNKFFMNKIESTSSLTTTTPIKPILKKSIIPSQPVNKGVTYDDILSSLNMTVVNGKLQIIRKVSNQNQNQTQNQNQNKIINQYNPSLGKKEEPIVIAPKLSKEEYKRHFALQYLQDQAQRKRIQELKSKKLLFSDTTSNINISPSIYQNPQNTNHLFKFFGSK